MAATERVVVLMTPEQKTSVVSRAAAEHLSVSDYMRRQALGDDELLSALMADLAASTEKTRSALDRTLARLDQSERRLPAIEATTREQAAIEFAALDPKLLAQMIGGESAA